MKYKVALIGMVLVASLANLASAARIHDGQYPATSERARAFALPDCGFAATESWGPNGFQYCDAGNEYPRAHPFPYGE